MNSYENSNKQKGFELNIIGYLLELSKKMWLIVIIAVVFGLLGGIVGKVTSKDVYTSEVAFIVNTLSENEIVNLDEERKAAMVSNLLVVLCANRDAQPIVNSGSLY